MEESLSSNSKNSEKIQKQQQQPYIIQNQHFQPLNGNQSERSLLDRNYTTERDQDLFDSEMEPPVRSDLSNHILFTEQSGTGRDLSMRSNLSIQQQQYDQNQVEQSFTKKAFKFLSNTLGIQNFLAKLFIFHPPKPSYEINEQENSINYLKLLVKQSINTKMLKYGNFINLKAGIIKFNNKDDQSKLKQIPYLFIKNNKCIDGTVIIYSHGNSSDVGNCSGTLIELAAQFQVSFIVYDYRGYGCSVGNINEKNMYQDLENMLSFTVNELNYKLEQIILWGFSLGSAPSVEIASRYQNLGGLILEAPLASVYVFLENQPSWDYKDENGDMFANLYKIQKVYCKILIIHGKSDQIIPHQHSQLLLQKYKNSPNKSLDQILCLFIEGITHNEIKQLLQIKKSVTSSKFKDFLENLRQQQYFQSIEFDKYYKIIDQSVFKYVQRYNNYKISADPVNTPINNQKIKLANNDINSNDNNQIHKNNDYISQNSNGKVKNCNYFTQKQEIINKKQNFDNRLLIFEQLSELQIQQQLSKKLKQEILYHRPVQSHIKQCLKLYNIYSSEILIHQNGYKEKQQQQLNNKNNKKCKKQDIYDDSDILDKKEVNVNCKFLDFFC